MLWTKEEEKFFVTFYLASKSIQNCLKIDIFMIYYLDKKLKRRLHVLEGDIITIKNISLTSLAQRMHFLSDVFQMTAIALVSAINHYQFNGLYLFWDVIIYDNLFLR